MIKDIDNRLLKAITNKKVFDFFNRDKTLIKNNAFRLIIIMNKEYLLEEIEGIINDY